MTSVELMEMIKSINRCMSNSNIIVNIANVCYGVTHDNLPKHYYEPTITISNSNYNKIMFD